MPLFYP